VDERRAGRQGGRRVHQHGKPARWPGNHSSPASTPRCCISAWWWWACPTRMARLLEMQEISGGTPYGASTITKGDGSRQPSTNELAIARYLGALYHHARKGAGAAVNGTTSLRPHAARDPGGRPGHLVSRRRASSGCDRRAARRPGPRHDAHRHGGNVRRAEPVVAAAIQRQARRGFPGGQGAAAERIRQGHDPRLRALAAAARDRPSGLLSPALARRVSARRNLRAFEQLAQGSAIRSWA
jgi:hypothetical protein